MSQTKARQLSTERRSDLRGLILTMLALVVVLASGLALGRVLSSPAWTAAVTAVGLSAVVLTLLVSPRAGLLAWMVLAPFASYVYLKLDLGSGIPNLDVTRLATLLLLFQLVSGVITRGERPPRLTLVEVAMVGFIAAMGLSALTSWLGLIGAVQTVFDFVAIPLLVYYFARNWLRGRRALEATIWVVALVAAILALIAVREQLTGRALFSPVQYSLIYEGKIRKVLSVFGGPASMTTVLAVTIPLLIYGVRTTAVRGGRLLLGLALIAVLAGVFFTYVRGGWLGAVVSIVVIVWLSPGMRRALVPLVIVIAVLALLLSTVAIINSQTIQSRLTSQEPIAYRLTAWRIAWALFRGSPVIGIGYDNFGRLAAEQFGWNPHRQVIARDVAAVHNSFLYVLVSGGLAALLPYVIMFAALAWRAWTFWRREIDRDLVGVFAATLLGYLVIINTFDVVNAQFANMLFFLIAGVIMRHLEDQMTGALAGTGTSGRMMVGS